MKRYTDSDLLDQSVRAELRSISDSVIKLGDTLNDRIFRRMLIDFSWMSSWLEGNTYTLGETGSWLTTREEQRTAPK